MHHQSHVARDLGGLYRAATTAGERMHAAMLRYHGALGKPALKEEVRGRLEDYLACGQQYRTTLEMLLAVLACSALVCAPDEAARVEGMLGLHDAEMRKLYDQTRSRVDDEQPAASRKRRAES